MGYDGLHTVETPWLKRTLPRLQLQYCRAILGGFRNRDTALALGVQDTACRSHGLIGSAATQRHCKAFRSGSISGKGRPVSSL
jgi:hypothetical protein